MLIVHLVSGRRKEFWFDLSPDGAASVESMRCKLLNLIKRVHEVWLLQLELREIFKQIHPNGDSNQVMKIVFNLCKLS